MAAKKAEPLLIDMKEQELLDLVERLETGKLRAEDAQLIKQLIFSMRWMGRELKNQSITITKLRRIFGIQTESSSRLGVNTKLGQQPTVEPCEKEEPHDDGNNDDGPTRQGGGTKTNRTKGGHGRRGADDYKTAEKHRHPHPTLAAGHTCPDCESARLYDLPPGSVLRLYGQPPITAIIHQPDRLRCSACGTVFTAPLPESVASELADASAKAVVSTLHYGYGMPFYRLERLQAVLGVPLSDATQWDFVEHTARIAMKVWSVLKRLAAKAQKIHIDDTTHRVAELRKKAVSGLESIGVNANETDIGDDEFDVGPNRVGIYTTGVVAHTDDKEIYLYFTGRRHAGENLADLLKHRPAGLDPPMQVCDALSRNIPKKFKTVLVKCLTHGRRGFVDCLSAFPTEAGHVIAELALVYHHDSVAARWNLTPKERLAFHRDQSGPVMARLWLWMEESLDTGAVEENSGLGRAIRYMRRHWQELTAFLELEDAPLSNDLVERALKWAIQYRKNSQQYRTVNGALVSDILMSVIRTAIAAAKNPIEYLTALLRNEAAVRVAPERWLPWNYTQAVGS